MHDNVFASLSPKPDVVVLATDAKAICSHNSTWKSGEKRDIIHPLLDMADVAVEQGVYSLKLPRLLDMATLLSHKNVTLIVIIISEIGAEEIALR